MKSEFLGYETLIIFDDYNTKNILLQNIDEVYAICKTLKNDDSTFEIEYQKKYQLENGEILYGEKKYLTIPNNSIPKLYDSTQRDIKVGKNVVIVNPSNLYECKLEDNVFVGPFCEIQKGVKIGKQTRIQSHTFICELVTIGENCFIGHGVMFVNDLFSEGGPSGDSSKWKETKISNNVSIGSNAAILPVSICENVVIGAGSVITKDIVESGIYAGNPARFIREIK